MAAAPISWPRKKPSSRSCRPTCRSRCREAELDTFIAECIDAAGATSVKDLGKVMGVIKTRAAGRVDMSTVSARVRTMLTPE